MPNTRELSIYYAPVNGVTFVRGVLHATILRVRNIFVCVCGRYMILTRDIETGLVLSARIGGLLLPLMF